jgi:hypothetical protein
MAGRRHEPRLRPPRNRECVLVASFELALEVAQVLAPLYGREVPRHSGMDRKAEHESEDWAAYRHGRGLLVTQRDCRVDGGAAACRNVAAINATAASRRLTTRKVAASRGLTSNSAESRHLAAMENTSPAATPMLVSRRPWRSTMKTTVGRPAPNAMGTPISRLRVATEYEITP